MDIKNGLENMVTELEQEQQLTIENVENQVPNFEECCVMEPVAKDIARKLQQR